MPKRTISPKAFTLVELLCVITIVVVLVSMLTPMLISAREMARRAQCFANMHNIAAAGLGFAATHNGRGPGNAQRAFLGGRPSGSSIIWTDILNAEYYKSSDVLRGIWRWPLRKGLLTCPNIQLYKNRWYRCPYGWNSDATGGGFMDANSGQWDVADPLNIDGNFPHDTVYGQAIDPQSVQPMYTALSTTYGVLGWYNLGARLTNFQRPSYTYLIIESDQWGEFGNTNPANPTPATVVNASPNGSRIEGPDESPPWNAGRGGPGDFYGFRHTRPSDYALYQQKVTGGFAFVDGHVDVMNANVPDQNQYERFAFKP